jgi:hypothetical protein
MSPLETQVLSANMQLLKHKTKIAWNQPNVVVHEITLYFDPWTSLLKNNYNISCNCWNVY